MRTESPERRPQPSQEHRITRTRNRIPRSCQACRVRKLKCNREKPCQNCIVRGDAVASTCSYATATPSKASGQKSNKPTSIDVRGRIDRLETLVRSLISQENIEYGSSGSGSKLAGQNELGSPNKLVIPVDGGRREALDRDEESSGPAGGQKLSIDTRSTHWDAILHDITAIKDAWGKTDTIIAESADLSNHFPHEHRPSLLNGLTHPPDFQTLLASLPSKAASDKLINRFWECYNPAIPAKSVFHKATFSKEYERHWKYPTETKTIWLGMLFSMLCFAMQSHVSADEEPPEFEGTSKIHLEVYRIRTAQCLAAADVTKPTDYMIETLLLHSLVEYTDQRDGETGVWHLSGIIMRTALQQGYHRDPSQHPDISPFKAEMRRRIWLIVNQHDLLFSVQLGLPKMIRYAECDTTMPRNLYEEELDENMTELPSPRPMTEPTEINYHITKGRIMRAYGHVIEHLHILEDQTYDTVMRLDAKLIEARDMIPPHLLLESIKSEPQGVVMEKYILQHFFHKGICVLHRKYLTSSLDDDKYAYSRRTCIASSMALLSQQKSLHAECQPGGRLPGIKWYHFSLMNHDHLLAAMIICLALYNGKRQKISGDSSEIEYSNLSRHNEMLATLQQARSIWAEVADESADAKRATNILAVISQKLATVSIETAKANVFVEYNSPQSSTTLGSRNDLPIVPIVTQTPESMEGNLMGNHWDRAAYQANLTNSGSVAQPAYDSSEIIYDNLFSSGKIFNSFEPEHDLPAGVDWTAWDLYVNGANHMDVSQDETWSKEPSFAGPPGMVPLPSWL